MITGFPSPAQGYEHKQIDFNSILVRHPSATVVMRIENSRYRSMGIYDGDLVIIDRSKNITPNSLVVYEQDGRFVLGRVFNIKTHADDKRSEFRKDVQVRCSGESKRQVDDDRNDFDGDGKSEITDRRRAKGSASFSCALKHE